MDRPQLREGDGVVILRLGAVGDVIRTLPCLALLRESLPGLRIGWVVEPLSAPLLPGPPWLDRIFVFPRPALRPPALGSRPLPERRLLRQVISEVRRFDPTLALDFQGTIKSALVGVLSGARWRMGFDRSGAREGSFLLSNLRVRTSSPRLNRVRKNLELLSPLGLPEAPLRFPFPPGASEKVRAFMAPLQSRVRIAVHPGTSRRQSYKQWPVESYARLLAALSANADLAPILTWGPGEDGLVRQILEHCPRAVIAAPPTDLSELRELIASCHLFVGGDTGPMHLAWSQGVPVVALFGPTDPQINGPVAGRHRIVAPDWGGTPPYPRRGSRDSIRRITPEAVRAAIDELLTPRRPETTAVTPLP